ncbi:FAD-dependent oxidoreductase [Croceitalea sp. MTPC9]|uniref:NAD(P)/FAD-dependent oxidoreductase n=1 Tax=unclassified Croceitalea TaxID=2632280 RepID=UPI002B3BA490|nr:FAD-dependent oxidoreductase [Croceitalea sp. MTPC6]GMN15904.1 FAD-dependent oxidoreductase [Croceitalea sp. MTPC9]
MGKNVVIIGGGIIGLCSAYFLEKEGNKVTILDKSNMLSGASYVNAGYITPSHIVPLASPGMISKGLRYMFDSSSPFYMKPRFDLDFIKWAWYFKRSSTKSKVEKAIPIIKDINILSRELFEGIKSSGDLGDFHLERKGLLMLYQNQEAGDEEMKIAKKAKFMGLKVKRLDGNGVNKLEPNIKINAVGGVHYECDGHTTPNEFMEKMISYLLTTGVTIHKNEEVIDIHSSNQKIRSVETTKRTLNADEVIFAAGSWTSDLSKKLKVNLPMQAGKGYSIDVKTNTNISMPAILMEAKVAVTPMMGFTRFAGTMEFSGINTTIRRERVNAIANSASKFYENLHIPKMDREDAKCGLRPVTPDGLPYIGKSSKYKNLIFATGHAMMGWSLGPITGKLVAQISSNKKTEMNITSFSPDRKF